MKTVFLGVLFFSQLAFAETTPATIVQVVNFPLTVTYKAGGVSESYETAYRWNKVVGVEAVEFDYLDEMTATVSESSATQLKAKYCLAKHSAQELEPSPRSGVSESTKISVLRDSQTQGLTKYLRVHVRISYPYFNGDVTTLIPCQ